MEYSGYFICAGLAVESVGLLVLVSMFRMYGLVKHGTMWKIPHLKCILNFYSSDT